MQIRLGYVAISKTLDKITSSSTITLTNFKKNNDYNKINEVIISNLEALIEILNYNRLLAKLKMTRFFLEIVLLSYI